MTIKDINKRLASLKTEADEHLNGLRQVREDIQELQDEQQDSFDNMPESLQGSERGETCQARAEAIGEVGEGLEANIDEIDGLAWEVE